MLNAKRRPRSEQAVRYTDCDFSELQSESDELWDSLGDELETPEHVAERAFQVLQWLSERREGEIAVVAHGGLFHYLANTHPRIHADAAWCQRFENCQLKSGTLTWTGDGASREFFLASDEK